jgi:hypothetical protein
LKTVERGPAVRLGFHGIALGLEEPAQGFLHSRVVLDYENAAGRFGGSIWM